MSCQQLEEFFFVCFIPEIISFRVNQTNEIKKKNGTHFMLPIITFSHQINCNYSQHWFFHVSRKLAKLEMKIQIKQENSKEVKSSANQTWSMISTKAFNNFLVENLKVLIVSEIFFHVKLNNSQEIVAELINSSMFFFFFISIVVVCCCLNSWFDCNMNWFFLFFFG